MAWKKAQSQLLLSDNKSDEDNIVINPKSKKDAKSKKDEKRDQKHSSHDLSFNMPSAAN